MIDFNNIKKIIRVRTLELKEGSMFLRELSSADVRRISEVERKKKKPDLDKLFMIYADAIMCDEKGKLLNLDTQVFQEMPGSMLAELVSEIESIITGEKKS